MGNDNDQCHKNFSSFQLKGTFLPAAIFITSEALCNDLLNGKFLRMPAVLLFRLNYDKCVHCKRTHCMKCHWKYCQKYQPSGDYTDMFKTSDQILFITACQRYRKAFFSSLGDNLTVRMPLTTRKHSSRMRTAYLQTVRAMATTRYQWPDFRSQSTNPPRLQ